MKVEQVKRIVENVVRKKLKQLHENFDFIDEDGWDEDSIANTGLLEVLNRFSKIEYEIKNSPRGVYAVSGDTVQDLVTDLEELKEDLEDAINDLQSPPR